ncbi:MAG: radical SAM protein, partial [Thermodesulfobacteriota bacterium]|nr:radical SAM protein [Thermodesulfobacteriota bacterium]
LAEEIRVFITALDRITSTVTSDHIMNLLEEVSGKFPEDKEEILAVIEEYQALSDTDRLVYRAGRRGGTYRSIKDLKLDPVTYGKIKNMVEQVRVEKGVEGVEAFITEMVDRYI